MRTAVAVVVMMAGSPASATGECEAWHELALAAMQARSAGVSESALLGEAEGSAAAREVVMLAFSLPRSASAEQFAADVRAVCEATE